MIKNIAMLASARITIMIYTIFIVYIDLSLLTTAYTQVLV